MAKLVDASLEFDPVSLKRAERAVQCSPFTLQLFIDLADRGIALTVIAGDQGVKHQYIARSRGIIPVENALLWLVNVGILRREVDGQGITDSFRLTPMGYYIMQKWRSQGAIPSATVGDRLRNFLAQWQPSRFI